MEHYLEVRHRHQDELRYRPLQDFQHQPHVELLGEDILKLFKLLEEQPDEVLII